MPASADHHDVWNSHLPLGVACNHCLHRASSSLTASAHGKAACSVSTRCRSVAPKCGHRDFTRRFFSRAPPGQALHGEVPLDVEAEWRRLGAQRADILAWARKTKALSEVVQTYRFERRQGAFSSTAHDAAAKAVKQIDPSVDDAMTYAGVCIEWAEREFRDWFWRCAPNHQVL